MSKLLFSSWITTPLGPMFAVADEDFLYFLEFKDSRFLEKKLKRLKNAYKAEINSGTPKPILSIEKELNKYFTGALEKFKTAIKYTGTSFQKDVWNQLNTIPYGKTISYGELAAAIGRPRAFRAAANANGANLFPIIIPCHRVIQADGTLGGYSGGIHNKVYLLKHEKAQ